MTSRSSTLGEWAQRFLDLIYPRECLVTAEPVEDDSPCQFLSKEALRQIYYIHEPHCPTCGAPFFGELLASRECPFCVELNPAFSRGRSLYLLKDSGREIIHEIKYRRGRYLLPDLQWIIAQHPHFIEFISEAYLIPIPLHPSRERERGFNQSRLIADQMEAVSDCQVIDCLERVKFTQTQTRLDRAQRKANLRGAFALKKRTKLDPDARYVLVDDVFTTGSTLNSAARVLLRAGAKRVDAATVGHG
ncbi:MAG: ComF family protein [Verrucomicrobiota bacterium]